MFKTKKKKIMLYLKGKDGDFSPFDELLEDYISGRMKERLESIGIKKIDLSIDWHDDISESEIVIYGRFNKYYVESQIEPEEFGIGCDLDEPEDYSYHPLESKEHFYSALEEALRGL
ncbi:MAG: hypothetical protein IJ306_09115 [Oscillospiraceae bacterium]|nr:hypothetical protein [Oscillospiraceae bacterium]